ncbi:palmitoyl-protein thioesterase 1 [Eupeodes corollae]|uniref:palmitoyl-protein thioesterase 1 n=1 Tax=Eupeodes corollae TaxID=290404 RepID=UPI002490E9E7|nr:palmitoyl-protein thioesterase 1 [Eupeodes corollae]
MNLIIFVSILLIHSISQINADENVINKTILPVVMWHGMGDTCCFPFSLGSIKKLIQRQTNNTYVKSLEIGGSIITDYSSGFFIHPDKQIEDVCNQIRNDPSLQHGYNAIGFSQGGQFLRAVAQKCPTPPMNNLISFGGQHQGIFGLPKCPSLSRDSCEYIRRALTTAAYEGWAQRDIVQATYWHDPENEEKYRNLSTFISPINNALHRNEDYIRNLQQLNKFIMVKFLNDTVVQPKESQWFGFYAPGQDKEVLPLRKTSLYLNDDLGLQKMDKEGKLVFLATEGDHLQFKNEWFNTNILPYLLGN